MTNRHHSPVVRPAQGWPADAAKSGVDTSLLMAIQLSEPVFLRLAQIITTDLGIKMHKAKRTTIQNRLQRRLRELKLRSFEEYEAFLCLHGAEERHHFYEAVTTNKTDFFREPAHFDYLRNVVLPEFGSAPGPFKIWSAACSTGEEPYTLAMVLAEFSRHRDSYLSYAILATDVSEQVLEHGRQGVYRQALIAPIPLELRSLYLVASKDRTKALVRIAAPLRSRVKFHFLNLMDADYRVKDRFQAIFLRNVMIYFDVPTQQAVVRKLCRNLVPGGYLFIGHSESLNSLDVPVTLVRPSIYRNEL